MIFRTASFQDLDAATLYQLLKLRVDVFIVEQECAYPELDGRDLEPGTRHLWYEVDRRPVAYLRMLVDTDTDTGARVHRIGRVATAPEARGGGLAGQLLTAALAAIGEEPAVLDAQSHLAGFYAKYGFAPTGPEFLDDGIPHIPMRRG
ncbi:GNAT family N-acetyltransferase [Catellatospora tritici]|uniref:GNAT family N-acetyltransferase n=1 Tax=Catellatospora tritici TaxID=2851566 RepID=UPI001C2DEFB2|nr:GNAT family N-acetyltransferase [Catellatospora tritici]MBV1851545.1 GNAT family N-acetyltransferase [Catellatospora tritici]